MINIRQAKKFCKEDISLIENYEQANNDKTQTWDCHHRDEVKVLPAGMTVLRSRQDLIDNDRYYDCPANELIFMTSSEHRRLHNKVRTFTKETRRKISESKKGKTHSNETRRKMSESHKGKRPKNLDDLHKSQKGKQRTAETRRKISESLKANNKNRKSDT